MVLPVGHTARINNAVFSVDGERILTCSLDQSAKIWDSKTGFLLLDLIGHTDDVSSAEFIPNTNYILTISDDNTAKIWNSQTAELVFDLKGHSGEILFHVFSSDKTKLATISKDNTAKLWNVATGSLLCDFKGHIREINSAIFSPDGSKFLTASDDKTTRIWDIKTGKIYKILKGHNDCITSAIFSKNGYRVLTTSEDSTVKVWEIKTGEELLNLKSIKDEILWAIFNEDDSKIMVLYKNNGIVLYGATHGEIIQKGRSQEIYYSSFSFDSSKFYAISNDDLIEIWNTDSTEPLKVLNSQKQNVFLTGISPDGLLFYAAIRNFIVILWDLNTGLKKTILKGHKKFIQSLSFSPDGNKIVTCSDDNTAKIWDVNSGNLLVDLKGHTNWTWNALYSPDGSKIITATIENPYLWNSKTGELISRLKGLKGIIWGMNFSMDGSIIATSNSHGELKTFDAKSGKLLSDFEGHNFCINSISFSQDGTKLISASDDGTAKIWIPLKKTPLTLLKGHSFSVSMALFSPDGTKAATSSLDSTAKIWEVNSGKLLHDLKGHNESVSSITFSPDGSRLISTSDDNTIKMWEVESGKLLFNLKGHKAPVLNASFSSNDKWIISASLDSTAKIWDAKTGKQLHNLISKEGIVSFATFSPDNSTAITASGDGISVSKDSTVRIWDVNSGHMIREIHLEWNAKLKGIDFNNNRLLAVNSKGNLVYDFNSGKQLYNFIHIDSTDYINLIPSGYYQCTPNAAKLLHYVTNDLKVITFEQLDLKYNRPDKVLEAIGCPDTALINSYRKAYFKRIKKIGIDTSSFRDGYSVPEADFTNRATISFEQQEENLQLKIYGADTSYTLDRFNVWVNEVPLYGQRGISLRNKYRHSFDTILNVNLSEGENRIETSVTNINGTESYRIPLYANYHPQIKQETRVHFIGIGLDEFMDQSNNLQFSVKDIRNLAESLQKKYGTKLTIDTLFNHRVTKENVAGLKNKLLKSNVNDKVIISYSGHGLLSKDLDYFLSTYPIDFSNPDIAGLPYDELESLLDSIPARQKLLLIDACHSGEVDKEEQAIVETNLETGVKGVRLGKLPDSKPRLGLKNSFELMQELFVNVSKGTGATIISAAAGTQFALERGDLKNGVFTFTILEAMQQKEHMKVSELKKYVGLRVEELTKGAQKPTSRNEMLEVDWEVW